MTTSSNEERIAKGFFILILPLWAPFWLLGWAWEQVEGYLHER